MSFREISILKRIVDDTPRLLGEKYDKEAARLEAWSIFLNEVAGITFEAMQSGLVLRKDIGTLWKKYDGERKLI